MTGAPPPRERGFTLVEMLVALAMFALIAGAALGLLRGTVNSEAALRRHDATAGQVRRMLALWQADLSQAEPRLGFAANAGPGGPLVTLVRDGWANPDGAPRPPLQRLDYRWTGQALVRRSASHVDGAALGDDLVVLPLAAAPRLRLRDATGRWHDGAWHHGSGHDGSGQGEAPRGEGWPVAAELVIQPAGLAGPLRVVTPVGQP